MARRSIVIVISDVVMLVRQLFTTAGIHLFLSMPPYD
jgi:hypothetical protein